MENQKDCVCICVCVNSECCSVQRRSDLQEKREGQGWGRRKERDALGMFDSVLITVQPGGADTLPVAPEEEQVTCSSAGRCCLLIHQLWWPPSGKCTHSSLLSPQSSQSENAFIFLLFISDKYLKCLKVLVISVTLYACILETHFPFQPRTSETNLNWPVMLFLLFWALP